MISQGLAIAIGLASVPLTVNYLGTERYGVWLTISSMLSWLTITDFGLTGNALVNTLAHAEGSENRKMAQECVATAFWSLAGIAVAVGFALAVAGHFVQFRGVFRTSAAVSESELAWAVWLAFALFLLTLPLSVCTGVYNGRQEGYIANCWMIAANLGALVALIAVSKHKGGLPALAMSVSGTRVVILVVNMIYLFGFRHPWLSLRISSVSIGAFRRLATLGGKYLITQVSSMAILQSQPIMITQLFGPSYVFIFTVVQRLLTVPFNTVYTFTLPLISAYGEAKARGDWEWVWHAFRRSMLLACAGAGSVLMFSLSARFLLRLWLGPVPSPGTALIVWFSVYAVAGCVITPFSQLLMGVERIGIQATVTALTAVGTVAGGIELGRIFGVAGVAMAMAISIICISGLGQWREVLRLRKERNAFGTVSEPVLSR